MTEQEIKDWVMALPTYITYEVTWSDGSQSNGIREMPARAVKVRPVHWIVPVPRKAR